MPIRGIMVTVFLKAFRSPHWSRSYGFVDIACVEKSAFQFFTKGDGSVLTGPT